MRLVNSDDTNATGHGRCKADPFWIARRNISASGAAPDKNLLDAVDFNQTNADATVFAGYNRGIAAGNESLLDGGSRRVARR